MNYSYDYVQARLADLYGEAERQRMLNAAKRSSSGRSSRRAGYVRRRRHDDELGGCRG